MNQPPTLPWELIDVVFYHLAVPFHDAFAWEASTRDPGYRSARSALLQCRLVSHSFREIASKVVFRSISLRYDAAFSPDPHLGKLLELIKAPRGGILFYTQYFSFQFPDLGRLRRNESFDVHCADLTVLLQKLLEIHAVIREDLATVQRTQLHSVELLLCRDRRGQCPTWEGLPSSLRNAIVSMCETKHFTHHLSLIRIARLPFSIFDRLEAESVNLRVYCPIDRIPPVAFLPRTTASSNSSFINFASPPTALRRLVTDSTFPRSATVVHQIEELGVQGRSRPELGTITRYAPTLRCLAFSGDRIIPSPKREDGEVIPIFKPTCFPHLETIAVENLRLHADETEPGSGLACAFVADEIIDTLHLFNLDSNGFDRQQLPLLRKLMIRLRLYLEDKWSSSAYECPPLSWGQSQFGVKSWPDLDELLVTLLAGGVSTSPAARRALRGTGDRPEPDPSLVVEVRFAVYLRYSDSDPPLPITEGHFREEQARWAERGWPLSSVSDILPSSIRQFPDRIFFGSSFEYSNK